MNISPGFLHVPFWAHSLLCSERPDGLRNKVEVRETRETEASRSGCPEASGSSLHPLGPGGGGGFGECTLQLLTSEMEMKTGSPPPPKQVKNNVSYVSDAQMVAP